MYNLKKKTILWIINHFLSGTHAFTIKRALLNSVKDISLGNNVKIVGPIYLFGSLEVGNDTWIGHDFYLEGNGHVSIGSNCDIAPFVSCYTGSHEIGTHEKRGGGGINGVISIGNGCWICGSVKILLGSVILDGAVVSAGSVVIKFVENDCLFGGVPAKLIKRLD